ncbi:hypothetical protein Q8A67_020417 [Cirrhinus molitorella]|uniref:Uncharacterized protein n=1 Tax=Cirrhinus molitorella TaxID=172907 RepID=A0AA88TGY3_9TELE|nr:hypothetical protein Q8A67_020417 [Cirrhinus molitorella]
MPAKAHDRKQCPFVVRIYSQRLTICGEAMGSWGNHIEVKEGRGVPLMAPEFVREFGCRDDDSVSLDAGEEFSDDAFQVGQILRVAEKLSVE